MKSVYLTGFMGAGKTTIGQALADMLSLPVYDTDTLIEKNENMKIKDLFQEHGENHFRQLEVEILKELPTSDAIVTTGGGIVTVQQNIEWMRQNGCMIFLYADPEVIWERLKSDTARPLVQQKNKEEVLELFHSRLPLYQQADITVDTTGLTLEASTEAVQDAIKKWKNSPH